MILKGEGFMLREWSLNDVDDLVDAANDIRIWNNVRDGFPYPYTKLDAISFITFALHTPYVQNMAIEVEGHAVGNMGVTPMSDVERHSAELGYWLAGAYWGQGIASRALHIFVHEYLFCRTDIMRLFATVFEYNVASVKVLENNGFRRVGILRKAACKNGRFIDLHYYELLRKHAFEEGDPDRELPVSECPEANVGY